MLFEKEQIRAILIAKLEELSVFLVDLSISAGDKITVLLDHKDRAISLGELEAVHRFLNEQLDKENNDFELTVSSPGMDQPFKVSEQYVKSLGKEVQVKLRNGQKLEGILQSFNEGGLHIKTRERKKVEGSKKKEWVEDERPFSFEEIKEIKKVIRFN